MPDSQSSQVNYNIYSSLL